MISRVDKTKVKTKKVQINDEVLIMPDTKHENYIVVSMNKDEAEIIPIPTKKILRLKNIETGEVITYEVIEETWLH